MRAFGARDHLVTVTGTEQRTSHCIRVRFTSDTLFDEALKGGGLALKLAKQWASYSVYNERSSYRLSAQPAVGAGQYVFNPASNVWRTGR